MIPFTLRYVRLRYITLHYTTLHYITLHYITLHYITLHYITLHYVTLHYIMLHYIMYSTVQYSTVQYSTVQYSTVQYSTVQYSTVQYSTYSGFNISFTFQRCGLENLFYLVEGSPKELKGNPGSEVETYLQVCRLNVYCWVLTTMHFCIQFIKNPFSRLHYPLILINRTRLTVYS